MSFTSLGYIIRDFKYVPPISGPLQVPEDVTPLSNEIAGLKDSIVKLNEQLGGPKGLAEAIRMLKKDMSDEQQKFLELAEKYLELSKEVSRVRAQGLGSRILDYVKEALSDKDATEISRDDIEKEIDYYAEKNGINISQRIKDNLVDAAMCYFFGIACNPSVMVLFEYSPTVTKLGHGGLAPQLVSWMSVWFPEIDSINENGATERKIVPRIKKSIGVRRDCKIFVDGHADAKGSDRHNLRLSEERARRVRDILGKRFLDMVDLEPFPHGERALLTLTEDGKSDINNRRVDVLVRCG